MHEEVLREIPDDPNALFNRGLIRLTRGDFPGGWGDYEARTRVPELKGQASFPQPRWNGEDPRGKTINVSWAYASSYQKPISVPQSLILQMTRFGMNVRLTRPPEYKLMPDIVQQAADNVRRFGGSFEQLEDFDAGFKDARRSTSPSSSVSTGANEPRNSTCPCPSWTSATAAFL